MNLQNSKNPYTIFARSFIAECRQHGAIVVWKSVDMRGCMIFDTMDNPNNFDTKKLLHEKFKKEFPIDA